MRTNPERIRLGLARTMKRHGRDRRFITERSVTQQHPQAPSQQVRCRHEIELDGTVYQCCRLTGHDGVHDGFCKHNDDGGLVRW